MFKTDQCLILKLEFLTRYAVREGNNIYIYINFYTTNLTIILLNIKKQNFSLATCYSLRIWSTISNIKIIINLK